MPMAWRPGYAERNGSSLSCVADLAEYLDLTVSRASSSRRFWRVVFICRSAAVLADDVTAAPGSAQAPTLITFGHCDMVCSTRFTDPVSEGIRYSDVHVFEDCVPDLQERRRGQPVPPCFPGSSAQFTEMTGRHPCRFLVA